MVDDQNSSFNSGSKDPYELLGVSPGTNFDDIKLAREKKISQAGDDLIQKAKIEAAYDTLLMNSLKARQLGKVSNEAINASEKEKFTNSEIGGVASSLLTRLKGANPNLSEINSQGFLSSFSISGGQGVILRCSIGFLALVLLLISPDNTIELILSLSTIGLFISQVKRGRNLISSLGWSVVLLSVGLILGGFLSSQTGLSHENLYSLSEQKLESLPALFLIFLGTIILD
ncbi:CPP1-like family protein [Prochlorococcus sp. MIT 1223]|uniref:CPP1-like family protein n=1 Tax=Prochlorococcus sp. MIT 1223 TaxID=3096217 RepID=UPI002A75D114|nr:CPP1-like family protein [Prochlorococcus sp. MIT 1223]